MNKKVSVIMPVLNGERFVGEAIESILAQTYRNYELIVVDDGSTDRTAEVVFPFEARLDLEYVRHAAPRGIAPSMNDGVRHAKGDLISFLDHDDAWLPDFLATQTRYLEDHPSVGMVHSDFQTTDVFGNVMEESVAICRGRKRPSGWVFRELFLDSFIVGNSVLIRKECFARVGMFDESLRWGDYHLWLRIARHYQVGYVPQVLTQYRQHPTQSTRSSTAGRPDDDSVGLIAIRKILEQFPELRAELGAATIRKRLAMLYYDLAYSWFAKGEMGNARICAARALRLRPFDPRFLRLYAGSFFRPAHAKAMRQAWRRLHGATSPGESDIERMDRVTNIGIAASRAGLGKSREKV